MPIEATWHSEHAMWKFEIDGQFTLAEIQQLVGMSDWREATRFLWDLRTASGGPSEAEEMRGMADLLALDRETWRGSRVGIVVGRDFGFAIARMFQAYTEGLGIEFEIFRDLEAAETWLATGVSAAP